MIQAVVWSQVEAPPVPSSDHPGFSRLTCEQSHKQQHQPQEGQEGGLQGGDWGRSPEN